MSSEVAAVVAAGVDDRREEALSALERLPFDFIEEMRALKAMRALEASERLAEEIESARAHAAKPVAGVPDRDKSDAKHRGVVNRIANLVSPERQRRSESLHHTLSLGASTVCSAESVSFGTMEAIDARIDSFNSGAEGSLGSDPSSSYSISDILQDLVLAMNAYLHVLAPGASVVGLPYSLNKDGFQTDDLSKADSWAVRFTVPSVSTPLQLVLSVVGKYTPAYINQSVNVTMAKNLFDQSLSGKKTQVALGMGIESVDFDRAELYPVTIVRSDGERVELKLNREGDALNPLVLPAAGDALPNSHYFSYTLMLVRLVEAGAMTHKIFERHIDERRVALCHDFSNLLKMRHINALESFKKALLDRLESCGVPEELREAFVGCMPEARPAERAGGDRRAIGALVGRAAAGRGGLVAGAGAAAGMTAGSAAGSSVSMGTGSGGGSGVSADRVSGSGGGSGVSADRVSGSGGGSGVSAGSLHRMTR